MASLTSNKKKKVHLSFIADLNRKFPLNDTLQEVPKSLTYLSINYGPENHSQNKKTNTSLDNHSVGKDDGISDKMADLNYLNVMEKKFWPNINDKDYTRKTTQQKLINDCIKNKERWSIMHNDNDNKSMLSIFEKKNESESKKSSIFHEEDSKEENDDFSEKNKNNCGVKSGDNKTSKNSLCSKSQLSNKTSKSHLSKMDPYTLKDASIASETEKVVLISNKVIYYF